MRGKSVQQDINELLFGSAGVFHHMSSSRDPETNAKFPIS
jgi:hypothetical protein